MLDVLKGLTLIVFSQNMITTKLNSGKLLGTSKAEEFNKYQNPLSKCSLKSLLVML